MSGKVVSGIMLLVLSVFVDILASELGNPSFLMLNANAQGVATVYIRADGSIDPITATLETFDNFTYTFKSDLYYWKVVIEKDNIILDGNGFAIQGPGFGQPGIGPGPGIFLTKVNNVTIRNVKIERFDYGIHLAGPSSDLIGCLNIRIYGNTIVNNRIGILISRYSKHNKVYQNYIANNSEGIWIVDNSDHNLIAINNITGSEEEGIRIQQYSDNNRVIGNNITNNHYGIMIDYDSKGNIVYHNNFIGNVYQALAYSSNLWDNAFPSGGNYWSDYLGKYPYAKEYNNSGIWDTPYVISFSGQDRYPLMHMFKDTTPPVTSCDYDNLWHNTNFTIGLAAIDSETDVAEIYYKINNGPSKTVSIHGQPLITAESANNTLEYWSVDCAGNEEVPHKFLSGIKLDKTAPSIIEIKRHPQDDIEPNQFVRVLVNTTDSLSNLKDVILSYCIGDSPLWTDISMALNTSSGFYECVIQVQQANVIAKYKITVYDNAGNYIINDNNGQYFTYTIVPEYLSTLSLLILMLSTLIVVVLHRRRKLK